MKNVTINEIANKLNISKSTVSKAISGRSDVNEKTREKVINLAKELNYVPNSTAISLKTKRTKTIGVIIPNILNLFFARVITGIIDEAKKYGFYVIILESNEKHELEEKHLQLLIEKQVDGILISLSNQTNRFEHLKKTMRNGTPIVLFDKICKVLNCSKVIIDDYQSAYNAVKHLIEKGYKCISHFRGPLKPQNSIDRFLGYKNALIDHGIEFDNSMVYVCDSNDDFYDGYNKAKKVLQEHPNIDAIFTVTDLIAVGALQYFKKKKIQTPKDIAVFGFGNWFMSSVISPPLSTIKQPDKKMGEIATQLLMEQITKKKKSLLIKPLFYLHHL